MLTTQQNKELWRICLKFYTCSVIFVIVGSFLAYYLHNNGYLDIAYIGLSFATFTIIFQNIIAPLLSKILPTFTNAIINLFTKISK